MALVKCKECGHDVSTKADACPNCGARQKAAGSGCVVPLFKAAFGLIGAIVGMSVAISYFSGGSASSVLSSVFTLRTRTDPMEELSRRCNALADGFPDQSQRREVFDGCIGGGTLALQSRGVLGSSDNQHSRAPSSDGGITPIKQAAFTGESVSREVLSAAYDQYSQEYKCWYTKADALGGRHCMSAGPTRLLKVYGTERFYILALGKAVSGDSDIPRGGGQGALVGAFVVEVQDGKLKTIAGNPSLDIGEYGSAPDEWRFVELGGGDYWGWQTEWGRCWQGSCTKWLAVVAPHGREMLNLARELSMGHEGEPKARITLAIKPESRESKIYPAYLTTFDGVEQEKTFRLEFDEVAWKYVPPPKP